MQKPVVAIPKAGSTRHVEENLKANGLRLGTEELEAIGKAFPLAGKKQPLAML
jgi:diketogulonate reductase-like aldo/keto reductase